MNTNFMEIATFIETHIMGCKFVGISEDNEVFVEFDHDDSDLENGAGRRIRQEFPYVKEVTVVVKPSITDVKKMIDDLNTLVEDTPKEKKLLTIGTFE